MPGALCLFCAFAGTVPFASILNIPKADLGGNGKS